MAWCTAFLVGATIAVVPARTALAVNQLKRGDAAPRFELTDLAGARFETDELRGHVSILVFGEPYHRKTLAACQQIETILKEPRFGEADLKTVLIVAQDATAERLEAQAAGKPLPPIILRDLDRSAYEAYRVTVLPSVVVLDSEGRVVHPFAAPASRFADMLSDSLLFGTGQIDAAEFERRLASPMPQEPAGDEVRARRLTQLADQFARRGLVPMAEQKYAEALGLLPNHLPAQLGLGMLELKRRRLAGAERRFKDVLASDPDSADAALGLAFVHTLRGEDELPSAERLVRGVLTRNVRHARAHYLLGLIQEKRGDVDGAAASFKQAAELLMEQHEAQGPVS